MLRRLGLNPADFARQTDPSFWPEARVRLETVFRTRTRDEWADIFAGSDACVAPVLTLAEAQNNEQLRARSAYVEVDGVAQSAPAPRFSRTPPDLPISPQVPDAAAALAGWLPPADIDRHRDAGLFA